MIRKAVWGGRFYPASEKVLKDQIEKFIDKNVEKLQVKGIVVPHAGYIYSGQVAGAVYSRIELPDRFIIVSPNHWEGFTTAAIDTDGQWETALGKVDVDTILADLILDHTERIIENKQVHKKEHAIEVQLPFIQHLIGNDFKFVPVSMLHMKTEILDEIAGSFTKTIQKTKKETLLIASSDMSHYVTHDEASKMDRLAIDKMLELDPEGLYKTVRDNGITMCGLSAIYTVMSSAIELGARNAELIKYTTSGETSGDYDQVVGYAGVVFH